MRMVFDFETIDQTPRATVLSCAVTFFDDMSDGTPWLEKDFSYYVKKTHYWKFDVAHQIEHYKRTVSDDTLNWWSRQDKEVRDSQLNPTEYDCTLLDFILDLRQLLIDNKMNKHSLAFCRGQSFDFPILSSILNDVYSELTHHINPIEFPVGFWNQRDIRSYIGGLLVSPTSSECPMPDSMIPGFKKHDPIHDNAKSVIMIQYAEAAAQGVIDLSEEND